MTVKYTKEILEEATQNSESILGVLRYLGLKATGGSHGYITKRLNDFQIDYSHFTGQAHQKGKKAFQTKKPIEEILVLLPIGSRRPVRAQLYRALLASGIEEKCGCGITNIWNNKPIQLEIDHIDGNWLNNLLENLRFICPNCHSQQETSNKSWKNTNKYGTSTICNCGGYKTTRAKNCSKCYFNLKSDIINLMN